MNMHEQDRLKELENMLHHAKTHPFFDLEKALSQKLSMWMHEKQEMHRILKIHTPLSIVHFFDWGSGKVAACLHKAKDESMYIVRKHQLQTHLSNDPVLQDIEKNDRVIVVNAWAAPHLQEQEIERIFLHQHQESDEFLQNELCLQAKVCARGESDAHPELFAVIVLRG